MIIKHSGKIFLFLISYFLFLSSCKKDTFITSKDASITTSVDSVKFDTVFTAIGSITQIFTINNTNNQQLLLSQVKLMGGVSSPFKININGIASSEADNITIAANDSIYVFVTVTINQNTANLPFIVSDSILISYNGNNQFIQLQAYGKNAHFINSKLISHDTTWTNDLPYVILGGVIVDTSVTLTIDKGCRIYSHANAPFLVEGTLIINGTKQDSVTFTGDRLDAGYANLPASWPGIYFLPSSINNVFTHANIINAYQAIVVDSLATNSNPKLTLHQCIINNSYDAGILCYNTSMNADNCLVSNCGSNIELTYGGNYNLVNCTVASFGNFYIAHKNPVLQVSNYDASTGVTLISPLKAVFQNCILWGDYGNVNDEAVVSIQGTLLPPPPVTFDHCLYKAKDVPSNSSFSSVITNVYPGFDTINVNLNTPIYNFHIDSVGPGIGAGNINYNPTFTQDLDDKPRAINNKVDLGCYEKQQ